MNKPEGWMDQDHGIAKYSNEASLLDLYRALTPMQREKLFGMAEELADLNAAALRAGQPPPDQPGATPRDAPKH